MALREPMQIDGKTLSVSSCISVAMYPRAWPDANRAVAPADAAITRPGARPRLVVLFEPEMLIR